MSYKFASGKTGILNARREALIIIAVLVAVSVAALAKPVSAADDGWRLYDDVVSEELTYTAVKGDTLLRIAGKLGVELGGLLRQNPREGDRVNPGDTFRVSKRTIIPADEYQGIVINIPDRMLYLFRDGYLSESHPVGLGKSDWQTPTGKFRIIEKKENPTWHVPISIQREMEEEGKKVITKIEPGPDNPLGKWAFRTTIPGIMIHETNAPESVYRFRSHGCIRMRGDDVSALFKSVPAGETGRIIYRPVKLALTPDGSVYLEVHSDVYEQGGDPVKAATEYINASGLGGRVDWDRVKEVASRKDGIAEDITLRAVRSSDGQAKFSQSGVRADDMHGAGGSAGKAGRDGERPKAL